MADVPVPTQKVGYTGVHQPTNRSCYAGIELDEFDGEQIYRITTYKLTTRSMRAEAEYSFLPPFLPQTEPWALIAVAVGVLLPVQQGTQGHGGGMQLALAGAPREPDREGEIGHAHAPRPGPQQQRGLGVAAVQFAPSSAACTPRGCVVSTGSVGAPDLPGSGSRPVRRSRLWQRLRIVGRSHPDNYMSPAEGFA